MNPLLAEQLKNDPRIIEAKRLIKEALAQQQNKITAIRPSDPALAAQYAQAIANCGTIRGGALYYPYLGSGLGNGPLVELADGSVKFDMISGIGVHHWGHNHPMFVEAALNAALGDTIMQGNLQQNTDAANLAADLTAHAALGSEIKHCFLTTSGAMANENALKLAFHKKPGATRILANEHAFAGRTLALAQITDKAAYRVGLPTVLAVDYVPFFDANHPAESTARAVEVLRSHLARFPAQHAAMWFELVQGEGGFYPGEKTYFQTLMGILREHHVAIVMDEIQTFGRTSRPFAFQHFGLEGFADIVTVGKMLQVCATLFTDALTPAAGLISQTFSAATSSIHAARAILDESHFPRFFGPHGRNMQVHARFVERFAGISAHHPAWLRGPFGLGGMIAFTPFDGSEVRAKRLLKELFDRGVIAFSTGANPSRIRMLPPIGVISDTEITAVCDILQSAMQTVATEMGGS